MSCNQGREARKAFFQMMNEWFTQYIRMNPTIQQPSPPLNPQLVPVAPKRVKLLRLNKPPVDKIRKHGAEEFRANVDDNPERSEFCLKNTIRVFDELSCTLAGCLECAILFLRDTAYQWWNTLVSVVLRERVTWEFFHIEFKKKYISQQFLDQKHEEFLDLKQGRMTVTEHEKDFHFECKINQFGFGTWYRYLSCETLEYQTSILNGSTGLARPSTRPGTRACVAIFKAHGLATRACVLAM
ncbi:Protein MCM10 [Gossypium arboreum]|uniref:Protein MCM10 n=1 Tax=Gossypium arboreum TaxID=29729 RepID=A0A0B0MYZ3_GOSAR|nr:Protein MCM10 [Gossypium arboreum]